jgi:hypothetical protein
MRACHFESSERRYFALVASAALFYLLQANHLSAQIFMGNQDQTVNVYTTSGILITSWQAPGYVLSLATNTDGNLLMATDLGRIGEGNLEEYTLWGIPVADPLIDGIWPTPSGLVTAGTNFYLMNDDWITQYATDGTYINTGVNEEGTLAYDPAGYLFLARRSDNAIGKYGMDGSVINDLLITNLPGTNEIFFGMAIDNSGHLFVACPGNGTIAEYTTSGDLINPALVSGLDYPSNVSLDESNNLFVLDYYSTIVGEYTSSGATVNASLFTNGTWANTMMYVPPTPRPPQFSVIRAMGNGLFEFGIVGGPGTNFSGLASNFSVLASTNVTLPVSNWTVLNSVTQPSPGVFQFIDPSATSSSQGYYRLRWP